jgi:hypothetical protein
MRILTSEDIHRTEASELSDALIDGEFTLSGAEIPLPVVLDLVDRLLGLLSRGGVRRRMEHLEEVSKAQQLAIRMLWVRITPETR